MTFAATSRVFWPLYAPKMRLRSGLRPEPHWGSLQRSPDPLAGGEGAAAPSPRTSPAVGLSLPPPHFEIPSTATGVDMATPRRKGSHYVKLITPEGSGTHNKIYM